MPKSNVINIANRLRGVIQEKNILMCANILRDSPPDVLAIALRTLVTVDQKDQAFLGATQASVIALALKHYMPADIIKVMIDKIKDNVLTADKRPLPILACHLAWILFEDRKYETSEEYQSIVIKLILTMLVITRKNKDLAEGEKKFQEYLNAKDMEEMGFCTLLHLASQWGQHKIVKMLLVNESNANVEAQHHITPIMLAARNNHINVVGLFLENNHTDIWARSIHKGAEMTVFDHVVANKSIECFDLLFAHLEKQNPECYKDQFIRWLSESNVLLFAKNASFIERLFVFLHSHPFKEAESHLVKLIVMIDDVSLLKKFLDNKNPLELKFLIFDDNWWTVDLLYIAVMLGALKCLRWILALNRFDPHSQRANGVTPLGVGIVNNHFESVKCLLTDAHVDPNKPCLSMRNNEEYSVAYYACQKPEAYKYLELLLQFNLNPNIANKTCNISLLFTIAAERYDVQLAKLLLENHKTTVDSHSTTGIRALHAALERHDIELTKLFFDCNASANFIPMDKFPPIHLALSTGNMALVRLFLDHRDFNLGLAENQIHHPYLNVCIFYNYFDIAKELLSRDLTLLISGSASNISPIIAAINMSNHQFFNVLQVFISKAISQNIISREMLNTTARLAFFMNEKLCAQELLNLGVTADLKLPDENATLTLAEWVKPVEMKTNPASESRQIAAGKSSKSVLANSSKNNTMPMSSLSKSNTYQSGELPMSGRKYLKEVYQYDDHTISILQKYRRRDPNLFKIKCINETKKSTWFKGSLSTSSNQILNIAGIANRYLYIPTHYFEKQGVDVRLLAEFCKQRPKADGQSVKKLEGKYAVTLIINGQTYNTSVTHELKLHAQKDRLLLCPIPSDENGDTLYIAVKYLKLGLHETSHQTALQQSLKTPIKINTELGTTDATVNDEHEFSSATAAAAALPKYTQKK